MSSAQVNGWPLYAPGNVPRSSVVPIAIATHLLASIMELPAVSERLGHSSVLVTAPVYSHRITAIQMCDTV